MVLVPSDDDYKARCKAQEDAGCKDIPEDAIMEMKGNCNVTVQRMAPKLFKVGKGSICYHLEKTRLHVNHMIWWLGDESKSEIELRDWSTILNPATEERLNSCKRLSLAGIGPAPFCSFPGNNIFSFTANFALPEEDKEAVVPTFVEITFVELDREEAKKIVEQYNKVG